MSLVRRASDEEHAMKIKYVGPFDEVLVPLPFGGEVTCKRMHLVEVPDALGESLLEQEANWHPAPAKRRAAAGALSDEEVDEMEDQADELRDAIAADDKAAEPAEGGDA
jgi:hypothetical protein